MKGWLGLVLCLLAASVLIGPQASAQSGLRQGRLTREGGQGLYVSDRGQRDRDGAVEVWSGNGQIISGPGSGGTLNLTIEMDGDRYRSTEGPRLNVRSNGASFNDRGNNWNFQFSGNYLYVTLTNRNGQVINFTLVRVN
ncbi:hypothetical protein [Anthocerotibacter panamensis]|uniref:hypothetical protein n=1 Tax=Anthocerotibacter panamensis TaxID=2857077 RepID=UPI001C406946|nr:hypothetical protein [Anthocerotibacter panamensis]